MDSELPLDANPDEGFRGVDPELIPYLIAADLPDDDAEAAQPGENAEADDEQARLDQLRQVVEAALGGPDPTVLQEVLGERDPEFADDWDEDDAEAADQADPDAESSETDPDADRVRRAQDEAALLELNAQLAARAPEDDFDPSLVRVRQVLSILGDPQNAYPVIHVAGTNGKTSTSRVAAALLHAFGLRVGHFTSPHLKSVTERINLDGEQMEPRQFIDAWDDIAPYVQMVDMAASEAGEPQVSYFEALALMAFAAFADYPVDVAVLECGLGGRWDATNVVDAGVAVITSLSMDHERWLGHTLAEIAAEKAEIIKEKSFVVLMDQPAEALEVLLEKCREIDAVAWLEGRDWEVLSRDVGVGGQMISVRTPAAVYQDLFVPLNGEFQAHNAAAALVAVESMMGGRPLPGEILEQGMAAASSPGRIEVVRTSPTIVVDGAHNPGGVAALVETLPETFQFDYKVGMFAAMADKNVEEMLGLAEPYFDDLVVTTLPGPRAMPLDDLEELAVDVFGRARVHRADTLEAAIDKAGELADSVIDPTVSRGIVAFGSLKLVGAIKILTGR